MKMTQLFTIMSLIILSACNSSKPAASPGNASTPSLTGTYWKLTELNGKPVGDAEEGKRREIYLSLTSKENRVSGNAGCNGFGGTYTLQADGFRLSFSQMMRTQMACDGLDLENEFMGILEKTDSYYITNNILQLNRAKMAPLAKFIAVPGKSTNEK